MKRCSLLHAALAAFLCSSVCLVSTPSIAADRLSAQAPAQSALPSLVDKRVLWLGDSITQAGEYVGFVEYFLNKQFPGRTVDIISIGLGSETTSGLSEKAHPFPRPCVHERLQRALDAVKPNVVVACYGMNDGIYHPQSPERMQAFQGGIGKLIAAAKAAQAEVILLTPPPYDATVVKATQKANAPEFGYTRPFEGYDTVLGDYARWELSLKEPGVSVIDLHTPMKDCLAVQRAKTPEFKFNGDGIHPDAKGHLLMAETILKALGIPAEEGDLTAQYAKISADPLYKLVEGRRKTRSNGWRDYVGYTRGNPVKAVSVEAQEQKALELQKQIDTLRKAAR